MIHREILVKIHGVSLIVKLGPRVQKYAKILLDVLKSRQDCEDVADDSNKCSFAERAC